MNFRKATVWTILAAVMSMSQMQCSKSDAPIRDEEASNGSEPRVKLVAKYPPGTYEMIQIQDMTTKGTVRAGDRKQKISSKQKMTQWVDINVTPAAAGSTKLAMDFKRIRQETTGGPASGVIDTSDPASLSGNPGAKVFSALLDAEITMDCDADGKVSNVSGMSAIWDRIGRQDPQMRQMAQQLKKTLGDKAMGKMISMSQDFMPKEPVGAGAVWYADFSMPIPMAGDMGCEAKCKLIELKTNPAGENIAVIEMKARMTSKGGETTQIGPGSMKIDALKMTIKGRMDLNTDNGMMSKQSMDIDGSMSVKVEAQGQTITTDAEITGTQSTTFTKTK
ncbi:MAG: DUF6263 family protein [Phycisphaerae bacterium]|jgi:hypothetical protein|nr:DUF6263 family protein [Phycisphaerae bacterium]